MVKSRPAAPARSVPDGRKPGRVGRDGFTLVEILVVLVILTIGIVPLAVVQSSARREVSESDRYTQALVLAQDRLERMKALGFGVAAPDSGASGQLAWNADVQNVSFGLDRIGVTVTWFDGGQPQQLRMVSLVSMR